MKGEEPIYFLRKSVYPVLNEALLKVIKKKIIVLDKIKLVIDKILFCYICKLKWFLFKN